MKNLVLLVIFSFLFLACEKEEIEEPCPNPNSTEDSVKKSYTISGTLYNQFGDAEGVANAEVVVEIEDDFGLPVVIAVDTTDENGNFSIKYQELNRNFIDLSVRWVDGMDSSGAVLGAGYQCLQADNEIDELSIYFGIHSFNVNVRWKIDPSAYGDTLYLTSSTPSITGSVEHNGITYAKTKAIPLTNQEFIEWNDRSWHSKNQCNGTRTRLISWCVGINNFPITSSERETDIPGKRGAWYLNQDGSFNENYEVEFEIF